MTGNETTKMQIKLKLDALNNSQLTREQLSYLNSQELEDLKNNVRSYLNLIESVKNQ